MLKKKLEEIKKLNVKLIAVTKYASDEQVKEAYDLGLRDFGENYVQHAIEKMERLRPFFNDGELRWHLLGNLQSNKVNKAVGNFYAIQSVDSEKIAKKINDRAKDLGIKQKIFLQINMTGDKTGFDPKSSLGTMIKICQMHNLEVLGLMTMGFHKISEKTETIYSEMRQLKRILESDLDSLGLNLDLELSMGMSNDYRVAVKNGSTMIRLGRELFARE